MLNLQTELHKLAIYPLELSEHPLKSRETVPLKQNEAQFQNVDVEFKE
jgi:hypothetical protein